MGTVCVNELGHLKEENTVNVEILAVHLIWRLSTKSPNLKLPIFRRTYNVIEMECVTAKLNIRRYFYYHWFLTKLPYFYVYSILTKTSPTLRQNKKIDRKVNAQNTPGVDRSTHDL